MRVALGLARMVVIGGHRRLGAGVGEQLGADPFVLGEDAVGAAQRFGGARRQVAEIADRGRDHIQTGGKALVHRQGHRTIFDGAASAGRRDVQHKVFQSRRNRVIFGPVIVCPRGVLR